MKSFAFMKGIIDCIGATEVKFFTDLNPNNIADSYCVSNSTPTDHQYTLGYGFEDSVQH